MSYRCTRCNKKASIKPALRCERCDVKEANAKGIFENIKPLADTEIAWHYYNSPVENLENYTGEALCD